MPATASPRPPTTIIRTLNEAGSIETVLRSIPPELFPGVLVVDGGSTDGTPDIARACGARVIRQSGEGLGDAILSGIRAADSDRVLMMCGDGSYSGEALPRLIAELDRGYDVVVASRYSDGPEDAGMFSPRRRSTSEDDTLVRAFGNRMFTSLCRLLFGLPIHDVLNGVKGFRRKVYDGVERADAGFDLEMLVIARERGYRMTDIPIVEKPRMAGESKVKVGYHGWKTMMVVVRALGRKIARRPGIASGGLFKPPAPSE